MHELESGFDGENREFEGKKPLKQLYRVDVPLKIRKDKTEKPTIASLMHLGMPPIESLCLSLSLSV